MDSSCDKNVLGLVQNNSFNVDNLLHNYKDVYDQDISKPVVRYKVHIQLKPNAMPIYRKYYEIPIHLRDQVYEELRKLKRLGIIKSVKYPE